MAAFAQQQTLARFTLDLLRFGMDKIAPPPGLAISLDQGAVVIRVEREFASPMLSILLHSKFSDGPRIDFLTSPHTNKLIEVFMAAASLTEYMGQREDMAQALAPTIRFVEEWASQQNCSAEETASLMQSAVYPYSVS